MEVLLKIVSAVELSWLSKSELIILSTLLEKDDVNISLDHAQRLRKESKKAGGHLKKEDIVTILNEKLENKKS